MDVNTAPFAFLTAAFLAVIVLASLYWAKMSSQPCPICGSKRTRSAAEREAARLSTTIVPPRRCDQCSNVWDPAPIGTGLARRAGRVVATTVVLLTLPMAATLDFGQWKAYRSEAARFQRDGPKPGGTCEAWGCMKPATWRTVGGGDIYCDDHKGYTVTLLFFNVVGGFVGVALAFTSISWLSRRRSLAH
jgi:hypothetical protein